MTVQVVYRDPATGITGYTALSSDTLPAATPKSWAKITDKGVEKEYDGSSWFQTRSNGAALVLPNAGLSGAVIPDQYDSDSPGTINTNTMRASIGGGTYLYGMLTVNGTGDPGDANRFLNQQPNVVPFGAVEQRFVLGPFSSTVTRVSAVMVISGSTAVDGCIDDGSPPTQAELVDATPAASFRVWTFDSTDEVKAVEFQWMPNGTTSGEMFVRGLK